MRKIEIKLEDVPRNAHVANAIGYLSTWAFDGYNEVIIIKDSYSKNETYPDFTAFYKNSANGNKYVIGAIWDGNSYSFHS